jgi:hypothetical protein
MPGSRNTGTRGSSSAYIALDFYPQVRARTLNLLRCSENSDSIHNSLGIFVNAYAQATAGSTDEHRYAEPELFTAETPCGTYQGMTDQVVLSRTPGSFRTVLVPQGSSKPEWLA